MSNKAARSCNGAGAGGILKSFEGGGSSREEKAQAKVDERAVRSAAEDEEEGPKVQSRLPPPPLAPCNQ